MLKRKLSTLILATTITNLVATPVNVFAETLTRNNIIETNEVEEENKTNKATITKFTLYGSELLESYNEIFKMDNSNIKSITNNGGKYSSSTIDKAIDGNFQTHWETGTPNNSNFTNEVIITLNEVAILNRIVYAARPDAGGKGFAEEVEIYSSNTEDGEDFELVASGQYDGSIRDIVEIKFDATEFKRVKFVFKKANQGWASASEFMFYKEDNIIDKMNNIFTNDSKNQLSEEFNTLEKLEVFDLEASTHPLYSEIREDINNARIILEGKALEFTEAKVSNF
ncbi:MAG: discoidin domain-containing protein, partial [Clostridium celatum]|nr:discoidin domain-containing protein [Clostridium celatum]